MSVPTPRLPELRETSRLGCWLRRYLLPLTLLTLLTLAAVTLYAIHAFELDLAGPPPAPPGSEAGVADGAEEIGTEPQGDGP